MMWVKNMWDEITKFLSPQIMTFLSMFVPLLVYIVTRRMDKKKYEKDLVKSDAETDKTKAEAEKVRLESEKVRVEVSENYITSANALVTEYKTMLKELNDKFDTLSARQDVTVQKLETEIRLRKKNERIIKELYRGILVLLKQMATASMEPDWCVEDNIVKIIEKMSIEENV